MPLGPARTEHGYTFDAAFPKEGSSQSAHRRDEEGPDAHSFPAIPICDKTMTDNRDGSDPKSVITALGGGQWMTDNRSTEGLLVGQII